jgi:hypothetical protein
VVQQQILSASGRRLADLQAEFASDGRDAVTVMDMSRVETILVEHASVNGPYGAKGVGEPPCIEPPAAITIANATSVRVQALPITAEKIALARADADMVG